MFGQADAKLPEQGFLLCRWLGDAAQADLATVGGGKNDVGALQSGEQGDRLSWATSAGRYRLRSPMASEPSLGRRFSRCLSVTHRA